MNATKPLGHFYSPIKFYNGAVLKYEGIANATNIQWMLAREGMIMLPEYCGDRITADTHTKFP